ncbi:hypothetical protein ACWER9_22085 [Micromonospora sp. NPDC003944]
MTCGRSASRPDRIGVALGRLRRGRLLHPDGHPRLVLAFDPVRNLPPELRVAGPLAWLRDQTYRGSRRARGASAQSGGSTATTV